MKLYFICHSSLSQVCRQRPPVPVDLCLLRLNSAYCRFKTCIRVSKTRGAGEMLLNSHQCLNTFLFFKINVMSVHVCACIMCMHLCVGVCLSMYACMFMCVCPSMHVCVCVRVCVCVCVCVCARVEGTARRPCQWLQSPFPVSWLNHHSTTCRAYAHINFSFFLKVFIQGKVV